MSNALLDFLRGSLSESSLGETFEYRFLLSGCAYNGDLQGDYSKSTYGALLLDEPFTLWKVGNSYDDYPQELAVSVRVASVTNKVGNHSSTVTPHREIAADIAAILTLFLRRLVVVVGAVSETLPAFYAKPPMASVWPHPIVSNARSAYSWPRLPLNVIYGFDEIKYEDPNLRNVPVSPNRLRRFFQNLSEHPNGTRIVDAARLYHRAMECLFMRTEVSYLLLVCAAETIATADKLIRSEREQLELREAKEIKQRAIDFGLSEQEAEKLALHSVVTFQRVEKSKGQMFREFLLKFGVGHNEAALLFDTKILELFKVDDERSAIDQAYSARSGFVHAAEPFKDAALSGTSSSVSMAAAFEVIIDQLEEKERKVAPPIIWLERLVAHSIRACIETPI